MVQGSRDGAWFLFWMGTFPPSNDVSVFLRTSIGAHKFQRALGLFDRLKSADQSRQSMRGQGAR
jgi:hypothetical protein